MVAWRSIFGVSISAVVILGSAARAQEFDSDANSNFDPDLEPDPVSGIPPALPQPAIAPGTRASELQNIDLQPETGASGATPRERAQAPAPAPLEDTEGANDGAIPLAPGSVPTPDAPPNGATDAPVPDPPATGDRDPLSPEAAELTDVLDVEEPTFLPVPATTELLDPNSNPLQYPVQPEAVEVETYQRITLEQAIAIARRNNTDLRTARQQLEVSRLQLREALAAEFPVLSTTLDLRRVESAQAEISEAAANQDVNPLIGEVDSDNPTTSFSASLDLTYPVYTAGARPAQIRLAEAQLQQSQLEVEVITEQLRFDVTNAYYDVQEADSAVEIEIAAVEDAAQSLRDAQLLERAGLGTRFSVLQAEVELSNAEQALRIARANRQISRRQLADVLNVGNQVEVTVIEGRPEIAGEWELSLEESIILALRNRAELQQQLAQIEVSEESRTIALADIRPQVSFFTSIDVLDEFDDGVGFGDGFTVGGRIEWTLFDGGAARASARQEEENARIAQTGFEDLSDAIRLEVEQAFFNLGANRENIDTAELAVEQARESLRLARLRFQAGVGTQTDVINSQSALTEARGNLLTAIIDYNRSLAALERAVTNLPEGLLFDVP